MARLRRTSRGSRRTRQFYAGPWRGGATARQRRFWSSCAYGTRAFWTGGGGLAERCASAWVLWSPWRPLAQINAAGQAKEPGARRTNPKYSAGTLCPRHAACGEAGLEPGGCSLRPRAAASYAELPCLPSSISGYVPLHICRISVQIFLLSPPVVQSPGQHSRTRKTRSKPKQDCASLGLALNDPWLLQV